MAEKQNLAALVPSCSVKKSPTRSPSAQRNAWREAAGGIKILEVRDRSPGEIDGSPVHGAGGAPHKWVSPSAPKEKKVPEKGMWGSGSGKTLPGLHATPRAAAGPPAAGVHGIGVLSPSFDENTIEGKIARITTRLKRNISRADREELELELEVLQEYKKEMEKKDSGESSESSAASPAAAERRTSPPSADGPLVGKARRKIGAAAEISPKFAAGNHDDEGVEVEVRAKKNTAIPVQTHPHTMARMSEWKKELDRRIQEQREMDRGAHGDGAEASREPVFFNFDFLGLNQAHSKKHRESGRDARARARASDDNPLKILQETVDNLVGGFAGVFGLGEKEEDVAVEPPRPLPPQTFSRRL